MAAFTLATCDNVNNCAPKRKPRHMRRRCCLLADLHLTAICLMALAAVATMLVLPLLPVLKITGTSMMGTLGTGDIVLSLRKSNCTTGDIIAFSFDNNILVKRVIATSGQWVSISDDGTVFVDNVRLDEPYVAEKARGMCDIALPYQVPDGMLFVMGDRRSDSLDSRTAVVGPVSEEAVLGRLLFRVWPLDGFGPVG